MKLTTKQIMCLAYVAKGWHPSKITTAESLARKGLVEHTSLGWRLTPQGAELIAKLRGDARSRTEEDA